MSKRWDKMYYLLDEQHNPVPCSQLEWAKWFSETDRHVAETHTNLHYISTIFLGLDHGFLADQPPVLYETMVFDRDGGAVSDGELDIMRRYCTWDEAFRGHEEVSALVTVMEAEAVKAEIDVMSKMKAEP